MITICELFHLKSFNIKITTNKILRVKWRKKTSEFINLSRITAWCWRSTLPFSQTFQIHLIYNKNSFIIVYVKIREWIDKKMWHVNFIGRRQRKMSKAFSFQSSWLHAKGKTRRFMSYHFNVRANMYEFRDTFFVLTLA